MFFQLAIHLLLVTSALAKPLFTGYEDIAPRQAAPSNSTFTPQQLLALNIGVDIMAQKGQIAAVEMIQQMQQGGIKDAKAFNATKVNCCCACPLSIDQLLTSCRPLS